MNEEHNNTGVDKEKEKGKAPEPLTIEEKMKIINDFHNELKHIDLQQETIEKISSYIIEKIEKYGDYLAYEIFQILESETYFTARLEYLYIIDDIINKYKDIKQNQINKLYPYIKNICLYSYTTLNDKFKEKIKDLIKLWKKKELFSAAKMKELIFELKMELEPEITDDKDELNYLFNLYNNGSIKLDQNLINFSKELELLERTKDNKHRKVLLKMEKDLITKQFKIYNTQVQHLKEIDLILDKIKTFNEMENTSLKDNENENEEINNNNANN